MTSLAALADAHLGGSRLVVPELPGGPDLLGRDDRQYGQEVTWWWADDRRLVLPVDTGLLVATDPQDVRRSPLRLDGCARLLLVDAGAGGRHTVREARDADLVIRRSVGRGLLARARPPDPGEVDPSVAAFVGRDVRLRLDADDAEDTRSDGGVLLTAAATLAHVVLVLAPRLVVALRRPVETAPGGGALRLTASDHRVTWVTDDGPAHAGRPASLVLEAAS